MQEKRKGNPMIQVRLHPDVIKKVEQRSRAMGFITPSGKSNLAGYVCSLIMRDINGASEIIDGELEKYDIK